MVESTIAEVQVDDWFWRARRRWWLGCHEARAGRRDSAWEVVARCCVSWECSGGGMDMFGIGRAEG